MKGKTPPPVKVEPVELIENYYTDRSGYVYSVAKLIEHAKKFPVFDLPLAGVDLARGAWDINNIDDFIHHAKRSYKSDLKYPIILDHQGTIADGMHRLAKAIVLGHRTIKAVRLEDMPPHDRVEKDDE